MENLGISGPVPDTPPDEDAIAQKTFSADAAARRQSIEAAKTRAVATAAAVASTASKTKRPGAGAQSTHRTEEAPCPLSGKMYFLSLSIIYTEEFSGKYQMSCAIQYHFIQWTDDPAQNRGQETNRVEKG